MADSPEQAGLKYVDHPAPSAVIVLLCLISIIGLGAALVAASGSVHTPVPPPAWGVMVGGVRVLGFYFWPFYATYYTLSDSGLVVRYGPWTRRYLYSDFVTAYWQRGMFATRIGWPSVTPCVRLTNAVLLKRKSSWFGLYLTPNDPRAFLNTLTRFAPELTREAIL